MKKQPIAIESFYSNLAVAVWQGASEYSDISPFDPHTAYPEYVMRTVSEHQNPAYEGVRSCLKTLGLDLANYGTPMWNPLRDIATPGNTVVIKPNFVASKHQAGGNIYSVITHPSVIRVLIDYLYLALEGEGRVIIADAPQMDCNFDELLHRTQLVSIQELYQSRYKFNVEIMDLRDFWLDVAQNDNLECSECRHPLAGDPLGSVTVNLGKRSFFYGLKNLRKIYGADYNRQETITHHHGDKHEYIVSKTILSADVVISVPKLKVHKKVGVTLNSKGLVGISTNKNCLVHYTMGTPEEGGDQFPSKILSHREKMLVKVRGELSDVLLAGQNPVLERAYASLVLFYRKCIKPWYGSVAQEKIILDAGNWSGNDSAWRMVVDLARIILFADAEGHLQDEPQRKVFSIVDGIIGGENNGPLTPDEKPAGVVVAGFNPLATDMVCTAMMGLDYKKLKWVEHMLLDQFYVNPDNIRILGEPAFLSVLKVPGKYLGFIPHPGWRAHFNSH